MKRISAFLMTAAAAVVILSGCATPPPAGAVSRPADPLSLSIGSDPLFMRVDIHRATHAEYRVRSETDANGVTQSTLEEVEVPNPYHYLVARFGNGVEMDFNGNLSIDLLSLYHIDRAQSYRLTERLNTLLPASTTIEKTGPKTVVTGHGLTPRRLTLESSPGELRLIGDLFHRRMRIFERGDALTFQPSALIKATAQTITQPGPSSATFQELGTDWRFELISPDHLQSTNGLELERHGNKVDIILHSPGGVSGAFVLERTLTGCIITSASSSRVLDISRAGHVVTVKENGHITETLTIDSLTE
jgi:hypothetical protein